MKLVCSECGQGDFGWGYKKSLLWCDFCKVVTLWIAEYQYKKKKERERHGNRQPVNR